MCSVNNSSLQNMDIKSKKYAHSKHVAIMAVCDTYVKTAVDLF